MDQRKRKSIRPLLAYATIDMGVNIPYAFSSYYMLVFFTDVFRLPAVLGAVMLFAYRFIASFDDIPIGFFINRSSYKAGKYRPYYLWLCVPFAAITAMAYYTPGFSDPGKFVYALLIWIVWEFMFTVLNGTTMSLLPHIAGEQAERAKANSWRIICSILVFATVASLAPELINSFGGADRQLGFFLTACVLGLASTIPHMFAYFTIKEKPYIAEVQKKIPVKVLIEKIWANKMVMIVIAAYFFYCAGNCFRDQMTFYFVTHWLGAPEAISAVMFVGIGSTLVVHLAMPVMLKYAEIHTYMLAGLIGMAVTIGLMPAVGQSLAGFMVLRFLHGAFSALPANLIYMLLAVFVDKELKKNQLNLSEVFYTTLSFSAKIGPAFVLSLCWLALGWSGYIEGAAVQPAGAVMGIGTLFIGCSCVMFIFSALFMTWFIRSRERL